MTTPNRTAALRARYRGPQLIDVEAQPEASPAAGEVAIRVSTCGICGTDLHFYAGKWAQPTVTPGHEVVGLISSVGVRVSGWNPGDRVVVEPVLGCGHCPHCLRGESNLCPDFRFISVHLDGGFASSLVVPAGCLHAVPAGMSDTTAALAEPMAVAVHACRSGPVRSGAVVAICGTGSVGLLGAAAALHFGASQVICSARYPQQQKMARQLGAEAVAPDELEASVMTATGGAGADVVLETVGGAGQAVGHALSVVRAGGAVVLVGGFTRPTSMHLGRVVNREIRLIGVNCYSRQDHPTDFEEALQILRSGRFPIESLVSHHFKLDQISEAFAAASNKETGAIKVHVSAVG